MKKIVEAAQNLNYVLKSEHINIEYHPSFRSSALEREQVVPKTTCRHSANPLPPTYVEQTRKKELYYIKTK